MPIYKLAQLDLTILVFVVDVPINKLAHYLLTFLGFCGYWLPAER